MRIAYLDCFSGISGDMFMGALVDAGVPLQLFEQTVAALNIGARLKAAHVTRNGISATKIDVYSHGEKDLPREEFQRRQGLSQHTHPHTHSHSNHEHNEHKTDTSGHAHSHQPAGRRGLNEIRQIITAANISESAKQTAIRIFEKLGAAEAKIHGVSIEEVHFHEVGAVDALVDITCAAVGAEHLKVDRWLCSPLNVGSGTVECAHGVLPIPAPATLEILKDVPIYSSGPEVELVTPTGAAIVRALASGFERLPAIQASHTGYGAGSRDFPGYPNVVRLTLGEAVADESVAGSHETVAILEANLDDLSPQVFAYVMERALAGGALDAFGTPLQMKKSRPGMLLTVLAKPEDADRLTSLIFAETSTLGVRRRDERRQVLQRRWADVTTRWGNVRIKIASLNGTVTNYAPEFEDCRRIAQSHSVPLKVVMQEAIRLYLENPGHAKAPASELGRAQANEQHG